MALFPIYVGSFQSLKRKYDETQTGQKDDIMTKKDAYMFPVIGSGVLVGLYILFNMFSKEWVNMLLTFYFLAFGFVAVYETLLPNVNKYLPALAATPKKTFSFKLPWEKEKTVKDYNQADIVAASISGVCLLWYWFTKNWIANNILGLCFSLQGVSLISLGSYQVGCILLGGLFFYDIFWVFGTDVMVTVAKSFDAPIKLLFPKSLFAPQYSFSMLGLGDIVIPGIFIALLLRYDAYRARNKDNNRIPDQFPTPYFNITFLGYALGLITTIFIMHTFQAAQPALLYLVPACIGFSAFQAYKIGDIKGLFNFDEALDEKKDEKKEIKEQKAT